MRTGVIMGAVLWGSVAVAADADFAFLGPAPARNFQPIQLIFLHLPFEGAAALRAGEVALHLESAESNVIATTHGPVQSTLKFETNRTVIGGRYGLADGWEMGVHLPFVSRFGGFLDPIIDEVEGLFDRGNPERDQFANNSFGAFVVRRDETTLFAGRARTLEPGDLWVSMKREVRLGGQRPLLAWRAALKWPTGRAGGVFGSGRPDFGFGLAADQRVLRRLMLYLNLSVVYPTGPITPGRLTLNPLLGQSFAAELALTRRLAGVLHQAAYTSPMHGTGVRLLDGTPVELGLGLNVACRPGLALQVLAINNVSSVEPAADFTLLVAARVQQAPGPRSSP